MQIVELIILEILERPAKINKKQDKQQNQCKRDRQNQVQVRIVLVQLVNDRVDCRAPTIGAVEVLEPGQKYRVELVTLKYIWIASKTSVKMTSKYTIDVRIKLHLVK